jgi:hypothetical protein
MNDALSTIADPVEAPLSNYPASNPYQELMIDSLLDRSPRSAEEADG